MVRWKEQYAKTMMIMLLDEHRLQEYKRGYIFRTIDISSAYLYADIEKETYMNISLGYIVNDKETTDILRLEKGLHGIKQLWYKELKSTLVELLNFKQSIFVPGLYLRIKEKSIIYLAFYVDDIFIVSNSSNNIIDRVQLHNMIKDHKEKDAIIISKRLYIDDVTLEPDPHYHIIKIIWLHCSLIRSSESSLLKPQARQTVPERAGSLY